MWKKTKQFVIKDKNKIEVFDFPDEWYFGEDKKIPNGSAKYGTVLLISNIPLTAAKAGQRNSRSQPEATL